MISGIVKQGSDVKVVKCPGTFHILRGIYQILRNQLNSMDFEDITKGLYVSPTNTGRSN